MELSINALAALVRRGWRIEMNAGGIEYTSPDSEGWRGDWIHIPAEVAATLTEKV